MNARRIAAALVIVAASGCSVVTIDAPVGEQLTSQEKQAFVGVWRDPDSDSSPGEFRLASDGRIVIGSLKWDEQQQTFQAESTPLELRKLGGQTYLYSPAGKSNSGQFFFARVELTRDRKKLQIYTPQPEKFRAAVESGALPGRVETSESKDEKKASFAVHLSAEDAATREFLASLNWRDYFAEKPVVMLRMTKAAGKDGEQSPAAD